MSKKKIKTAYEIKQKFRRKMQKIIANGDGINKISIQVGDKPEIVVAEKKKKGDEKCQ